jgi:hypothetical protein
VFVAKITQKITQKQVADGFELNVWTLRRYSLPKRKVSPPSAFP